MPTAPNTKTGRSKGYWWKDSKGKWHYQKPTKPGETTEQPPAKPPTDEKPPTEKPKEEKRPTYGSVRKEVKGLRGRLKKHKAAFAERKGSEEWKSLSQEQRQAEREKLTSLRGKLEPFRSRRQRRESMPMSVVRERAKAGAGWAKKAVNPPPDDAEKTQRGSRDRRQPSGGIKAPARPSRGVRDVREAARERATATRQTEVTPSGLAADRDRVKQSKLYELAKRRKGRMR